MNDQLLLDTCTISDYFKKNEQVTRHFKEKSPSQLFISTLTVMEIKYSLHLNHEKKLRPLWNPFLAIISILPFNPACALAAATIRGQLKVVGLPIGPYDVLIAGTAKANQMTIVTSNLKEFERVGVQIENWKTS